MNLLRDMGCMFKATRVMHYALTNQDLQIDNKYKLNTDLSASSAKPDELYCEEGDTVHTQSKLRKTP